MGFVDGGGRPASQQEEAPSWGKRVLRRIGKKLSWWKLSLASLPETLPFHLHRLLRGRRVYVVLARRVRNRPHHVERSWVEQYALRQFKHRYKLARSLLTQLALGETGLGEKTINSLLRQGARSARASPQIGKMTGPLRPTKLEGGKPNTNPTVDEVRPPFRQHHEAFVDVLSLYLMDRRPGNLAGVKFEVDPALMRRVAHQPQAHQCGQIKRLFHRAGDWPVLEHFVLGANPADFHDAVAMLIDRIQNGDSFTRRQDRKTLTSVIQNATPAQLDALDTALLLTSEESEIRKLGLRAVGGARPPTSRSGNNAQLLASKR